jgi:hypothetical protein
MLDCFVPSCLSCCVLVSCYCDEQDDSIIVFVCLCVVVLMRDEQKDHSY